MTDRTKNGAPEPATTIINAQLIDPETGFNEPGGLVMKNGIISDIGSHLRRNAPEQTTIVDAAGQIVCPGLIDMQVFTGEPGYEHRETLKTASQAAAAGGVTTMICMPNTEPVIDDVALVDFIKRRARDTAVVRVFPMGAMTKGLKGEQMTEIGLLRSAGAVAFSNGRHSVMNARVMRGLLAYAKDFDAVIVHNTEDHDLSDSGVMNDSEMSSRLGLKGIPTEAETIMVERDIRLVRLTGGRYHAAQISCSESLATIKYAKSQGLPVTCGISINHLTLNENDVEPYRTFFKMTPPLRSETDRMAMVTGLGTGLIDVIVSNHDPQDEDGKRRPFAEASDGAIGVETMLAAALRLYHNKQISLIDLLRPMTINPARILQMPQGRLQKGAPADVIILDPDSPWVVDPDKLHSKSKNTPLEETKLQGRVLRTFVAGKSVHQYLDGQ